MTYITGLPCPFPKCTALHGVTVEPKVRTTRKAPDDSAGAGALRSGDIGGPPGAQPSKPVPASGGAPTG